MKIAASKTYASFGIGLCLVLAILFVGSKFVAPTYADSLTLSDNVENKTESRLETRCGWFSNPTPANAWLNDKDGQWIIGSQGGHQADGDWPSFKNNQWIKTNGTYGYGCACMTVTTDKNEHYILTIKKATARPISACRKDKNLKKP